MDYADNMCAIVTDHAGDLVRYFVRVDPDTREQDLLHLRADLRWTDHRRAEVDSELLELVAKEAYESKMDATNVTQIIKVADTKVLFTGFIEEEVVVAAFDRGIFGVLSGIVTEFREYMLANDIEFTELSL
ncbi:hypothetical protein [Halomarina litorea]|uniref:hypothetical protein n=1 Tax=Halomarina litorea TaxID=2961595 RepID=UPI0020C4181B|nr:hypothetical protein [Halomarina sp. BCD28]